MFTLPNVSFTVLWLLTHGPIILTNNKSQLLIIIHSANQY